MLRVICKKNPNVENFAIFSEIKDLSVYFKKVNSKDFLLYNFSKLIYLLTML